MYKVLVTGGCGYIGSHTIVDLINNGFEVISIDNLSRSDGSAIDRIKKITGVDVPNYAVDLCNFKATRKIFEDHDGISGIIHFAAFKTVPESVENPLLYYQNNLGSLVNVLECASEFNVSNFVFSSSCSVYGNSDVLPVSETTPLAEAESPYARTKQIGEKIIEDYTKSADVNSILLRYFNPVGAHESGELGELNKGKPENLVPLITRTAMGINPFLWVYGDDYDTKDGSCVRDYIHVMDIAHAHTLGLKYLGKKNDFKECEVFNLGTGNGATVLEMIAAFETTTGKKLNYKIGPKRPGDVAAIYADNQLAATKLNWKAERSLNEMMATAWQWEQKLRN